MQREKKNASSATHLHEDLRLLGVDAAREVHGRGAVGRLGQLLGVVLRGDRVRVDHAEVVVIQLLVRHPLLDRTQVVAEMEQPGGLHAREHTRLAPRGDGSGDRVVLVLGRRLSGGSAISCTCTHSTVALSLLLLLRQRLLQTSRAAQVQWPRRRATYRDGESEQSAQHQHEALELPRKRLGVWVFPGSGICSAKGG